MLKTLGEAIVLVIIVMFLFLQNWRSTVIPAITIPVSLVGTFAFVKLLGFSINTLTLFGIVLATGIVVDDAIVVIENIERHISQFHKTAHQAASDAMEPDEGAERSLNFPFSRTKSPQSRSSRAGLVLALILYWAEAAIQVIISTAKKSDFLFDLRGGQNA